MRKPRSFVPTSRMLLRLSLRHLEPLIATGLLALLTTLASVAYERRGPGVVEAGNLCGPDMDLICWVPALSGGFPLGYLVDNPNISVPNQLSFFEDRFDGARFALDVVVHWAMLFVLARLAQRAMRDGVNRP